jgi:MFS family permease
VPLWQIPLLWAFFNGVKAAAGVPGGVLSDRIGRVPCVAMGWIVYVLAYVGFAFVSTPAGVYALFGGYALFFALTEGAQRALVTDLVGESLRGRAFGIFHGSIGVAALPSSIVFGILWKVYGARTAFLFGAGLAALATVGLFAARAALRTERT